MSLAQPTYLVDQDIVPIDKSNPLPVTVSGGGGGTVDQGAANGDATKGWSTRLTDGAAFIVPAKTGQLPAALGATTAAGSVSVGIATDQLSTLATAAKQDTGNASLSNIDGKVATAANQTTANSSLASILGQLDNKTSTLATEATASASKTLLGAGLPAALVGGKLDVNLGTSSITLPVSGPLTDAQLRATPVPVSGTVTVTSTTANQGAGSGSAATFWYTRNTDGTNTQPTMDVAARSGFQRITDGTNTAAVKASATPAATTDPAAAVALSPNAPGLTVTMSSKSSSASSATMLASNSARKGATFYNDDANPLYLRTDGSAATTSIGGYTVKIASGAYYELPVGANGGVYQGAITGIWSATGSSGVSISEST